MTSDEERQIGSMLFVAEIIGADASPMLQRYAKHVHLLFDEIKTLRASIIAEREEWNRLVGVTHPADTNPLTPADVRLMRAIFNEEQD